MIPEKLIPLIYLVVVAGIGAGLHIAGVPPEMTGMIVGAGLTRVKIGPPANGGNKVIRSEEK
jgi:hypothetical protein